MLSLRAESTVHSTLRFPCDRVLVSIREIARAFCLTVKKLPSYDEIGRARWGTSGALYLQSATAGLNSP